MFQLVWYFTQLVYASDCLWTSLCSCGMKNFRICLQSILYFCTGIALTGNLQLFVELVGRNSQRECNSLEHALLTLTKWDILPNASPSDFKIPC